MPTNLCCSSAILLGLTFSLSGCDPGKASDVNTGGAAGTLRTGGNALSGGSLATGGASATGGAPMTGGNSSMGGILATGGTVSTGGTTVTGGTSAVGGTIGGGGSFATGGVHVTGGSASPGGSAGSGGGGNTGGSASSGGKPGSGGALAIGGTSGPSVNLTVYMIGDSTMADKPLPNTTGERGWGQMMPQFFKSEAKISNHAKNGRSSKSFIDEGLWKTVVDSMKAGDWLIAQFGHNDEKSEADRHTDPFTTYAANLKKFATEARAKGAFPILCTPIVRGGNLESHGDYPEAVIATAKELNVPLIDLEKTTKEYVGALGSSRLKEFYVAADNTHLKEAGATIVAKMAVDAIKEQNLPLAAYLK